MKKKTTRIITDNTTDTSYGSGGSGPVYIASGTFSGSFNTPWQKTDWTYITLAVLITGSANQFPTGSIALEGSFAPSYGRDPSLVPVISGSSLGQSVFDSFMDTKFPMLTQSLSFPGGTASSTQYLAKVDVPSPYMAEFSRVKVTLTTGTGSIRVDLSGKDLL